MLPPPAGRMHVARTDPKALSSIRRCRCAFEGIGQPNDNHPMVEQSWDHGQDGGFLAAVLGGGAGKHRAHLSDERAARPERAGLVPKKLRIFIWFCTTARAAFCNMPCAIVSWRYLQPPPLMWAVFFGARRFCRYSGALHQVESFAQRQVRLHEAAAKDIR
jgi:hypothetical protein